MIDLVDVAIGYARRGWHVIPLRPNSKEPDTKHGSHDATVDVDAIACMNWCGGIGVVAGPSHLVILDRDPRNNGSATVRALCDELGDPPSTVKSITGGGGGHAI